MKLSNIIRTTAVTAALGLAVAAPAFASDAVCTMATTENLNMRSGEGLKYSVVETIPANTKVEVFGMSYEGWYHIKYNGDYGYCWYRWLDFEGDASNDVHDGNTTYMYPTANVRMRSEPNTNCGVLAVVPKDTPVAVTAKHNGWFTVEYNGVTGYIFGKYLGFTQGGYTVSDDQQNTAGKNVMNKNNDDPGDTAGKNTMNQSNEKSTMNQLHASVNLNVRSQPNGTSSIIGSFKKGETVTLLADEGDWVEVMYGDTIGYCASRYLS